MVLQTSGPISINQMRLEYGLSFPVSMSQFYGKNGLPASGALSFNGFYGKANALDFKTITVGTFDVSLGEFGYYVVDGYEFGSAGTISSRAFAGAGGANIFCIEYANYGVVSFVIDANVPNSGWTTMTIGSTTFTRASATYNQGGGRTYWSWSQGNPFSAPGTTQNITWL